MLTAEQPQLKSSLLVGTAFVAWQQLAYLRVREDELRSIRASLIVYLSKEGWPWSCLFKVKLYNIRYRQFGTGSVMSVKCLEGQRECNEQKQIWPVNMEAGAFLPLHAWYQGWCVLVGEPLR